MIKVLNIITGRPSYICDTNILHLIYGIFHLCSKRFQNEIKIMKYLNTLDLLYFVIIMCCFGLVSGAERNKNGEVYIRIKGWKHAIDPLKF